MRGSLLPILRVLSRSGYADQDLERILESFTNHDSLNTWLRLLLLACLESYSQSMHECDDSKTLKTDIQHEKELWTTFLLTPPKALSRIDESAKLQEQVSNLKSRLNFTLSELTYIPRVGEIVAENLAVFLASKGYSLTKETS